MMKLSFEVMKRNEMPVENKSRIVYYLKHGDEMACAPMRYPDRETGEKSIDAYYLTDGVYCWSSDIIYHFEKYNYQLPENFVSYALEKMKRHHDKQS